MKILRYVISLVILITLSALAYKVIKTARENQSIKKDYAEINHFKYGLLSVDSWKDQLAAIILQEVDQLSLTRGNQKVLKAQLERQLAVLIDKIAEKIKKENDTDSPGGFFKQAFINTFVDMKEIKAGIPGYADAMIAEMSSKKSEKELKGLLKDKLQQYIATTFDVKDVSKKQQILNTLQLEETEARGLLEKNMARNFAVVKELTFIMIGLAVILFFFEGFTKGPLHPFHFITLVMTLMILLAVGVTTPMIDMEAKIAHLSFMLFGHPVSFDNQILYFQSKSIMDVFNVMITHKDIQMKLVGILMVSFSVFFPLLKMMSSFAYYYDYCKARQYKLIQFFVLKSGKWSMADVFVVAIFMSYIGFNGIINSQLESMATSYQELEVFTTNGTNLQPGFYLFFAYTVLAMFLANYLKNRPLQCANSEPVGLEKEFEAPAEAELIPREPTPPSEKSFLRMRDFRPLFVS